MSDLPYDGLRVVELSGDVAGDMVGKMLAQMGADVIKVEPPGGSPLRAAGPFGGSGDASLTFAYYNTSKDGCVVDLSTPDGANELDRLAASADVLLVSSPPQPIDPREWQRRQPGLVVLAVSPFGLDGPRVGEASSDLVLQALGGVLYLCGYDDHSLPPMRPGENQAAHTTAAMAHTSLLLALIDRDLTGEGQLVDVSIQASVALNLELALPYWFYNHELVHRQTCRHAQPSPTQPALYRTADGRYCYFALMLADSKPWNNLVAWMDERGMAADLKDPEYSDVAYRQASFTHIHSLIEAFFLIHSAHDLYHDGQRRSLPIGLVQTPPEVLADPQLAARNFFQSVSVEGVLLDGFPGAPWRFSEFTAEGARPAPALSGTGTAGERNST